MFDGHRSVLTAARHPQGPRGLSAWEENNPCGNTVRADNDLNGKIQRDVGHGVTANPLEPPQKAEVILKVFHDIKQQHQIKTILRSGKAGAQGEVKPFVGLGQAHLDRHWRDVRALLSTFVAKQALQLPEDFLGDVSKSQRFSLASNCPFQAS